MDFKLQMGRILAILGVYLSIIFLCGLLLLCVLPRLICFMFGVVWVFVLNCYVLGGEFEQLAAK